MTRSRNEPFEDWTTAVASRRTPAATPTPTFRLTSRATSSTPHFPQTIKGDYNNDPTNQNQVITVPGMDPPPAGSQLGEQFTAEYIWDVSTLGLPPGSYILEFVIHDGDDDRGVGCIDLTITP